MNNQTDAIDVEALQIAAIVLATIGALNWGLIAIAQFDLVSALTGCPFGEVEPISRIVYLLEMVAGVISLAAIATLADELERPSTKKAAVPVLGPPLCMLRKEQTRPA